MNSHRSSLSGLFYGCGRFIGGGAFARPDSDVDR